MVKNNPEGSKYGEDLSKLPMKELETRLLVPPMASTRTKPTNVWRNMVTTSLPKRKAAPS